MQIVGSGDAGNRGLLNSVDYVMEYVTFGAGLSAAFAVVTIWLLGSGILDRSR